MSPNKLACLTLGILTLGVAASASAADPAKPKKLAGQVITNGASNLCLGVRGVDQHTPGTGVEVYYCNPGNGDRGKDYHWTFEPAGDGYFYFKNKVSGLCLGVRGVDNHKPGTEAEVYHCQPGGADKGLDNQWKIIPEPDGFKKIVNRVSNLCLGVVGVDKHSAGAAAEVYACDPGAGDPGRDARWRFQGPKIK